MSDMDAAVADLHAEQQDLERVLRGLDDAGWATPTPAEGWDVRDQVAHLADTDEIAYDTLTGGERILNEEAKKYTSAEEFTEAGCIKGRAMAPADVLAWWLAATARTREAFLAADPKERVPWGLGMTARTLVTARLMEHWAHGVDIRNAVGAPIELAPRHRSVVWLITRAAPYAFMHAGREKPAGDLRVEVEWNGETWTAGPEDAGNRITGDALELCLLGVQRLSRADAATLVAEGPLADAFLDVARAFL